MKNWYDMGSVSQGCVLRVAKFWLDRLRRFRMAKNEDESAYFAPLPPGKTGIRSLNREHLKQRVRKKIKARAEKIHTTSLLYFNVCSLRLKVTIVFLNLFLQNTCHHCPLTTVAQYRLGKPF